MSLVLTCPGCGTRLKVPNDAVGKSAKCPKCAKVVGVPTAEEPLPPLPPPIADPPEEDRNEEDDPQRKRGKRRNYEEDEDERDEQPKRQQRRRQMEEDEDEPTSKTTTTMLIMAVGVLGIFALVVFVTAAIVKFSGRQADPAATNNDQTAATNNDRTEGETQDFDEYINKLKGSVPVEKPAFVDRGYRAIEYKMNDELPSVFSWVLMQVEPVRLHDKATGKTLRYTRAKLTANNPRQGWPEWIRVEMLR
jgi:hypothetical protein